MLLGHCTLTLAHYRHMYIQFKLAKSKQLFFNISLPLLQKSVENGPRGLDALC